MFESKNTYVEINRSTGLIDSYRKNGQEYVKPGAFSLEVFDDNYDPWYMENVSWKNKLGSFVLLSSQETQRFCCTDSPIDSVHVIESGDVRTIVEAAFGYNSARALVKYILSQKEGLRIDIHILWDEKQKLIKLNIPAAFNTSDCIGEHAYGREALKKNMVENVSQKYIIICGEDKGIIAANNGVYGSSYDENNNELKITLLRSPSYTAHPIEGRVVMPQDRYMPYIEQGEREFSFAFDIGNSNDILNNAGRFAAHFNTQPMLLSFYPTGVGEKPASPIRLEGNDIIQITAFKRAENSNNWIIRLFNPTQKVQTAQLTFNDNKSDIIFNAYEIKTVLYDGHSLSETDLLEGLLSK